MNIKHLKKIRQKYKYGWIDHLLYVVNIKTGKTITHYSIQSFINTYVNDHIGRITFDRYAAKVRRRQDKNYTRRILKKLSK